MNSDPDHSAQALMKVSFAAGCTQPGVTWEGYWEVSGKADLATYYGANEAEGVAVALKSVLIRLDVVGNNTVTLAQQNVQVVALVERLTERMLTVANAQATVGEGIQALLEALVTGE